MRYTLIFFTMAICYGAYIFLSSPVKTHSPKAPVESISTADINMMEDLSSKSLTGVDTPDYSATEQQPDETKWTNAQRKKAADFFNLSEADIVETLEPDSGRSIDIQGKQTVEEASLVSIKAIARGLSHRGEVNFRWRQLHGEPVQIIDPRSSQLSFVTPAVDEDIELKFSIYAFVLGYNRLEKEVTVRVLNAPDNPEVFAGEDIIVEESTPVIMYGYGQAANGTGVDFSWSIVTKDLDNYILENAKEADATLIPPALIRPQTITLQLEVTDAHGRKAIDLVKVTVEPEKPEDLALVDVVIEDYNLSSCINERANEHGWYYASDVNKLICNDRQIKRLAGLEYFSNLRWIMFSNNELTSIDPLSHLHKLIYVTLRQNQIRDLSPLKHMEKLAYLDLSGNRIESITELETLPGLIRLLLTKNPIKDINPLYRVKTAKGHEVQLHYRDLDCQIVLDLQNNSNVNVVRREDCGL